MKHQNNSLWPTFLLATLLIVGAGALHAADAQPAEPSEAQWRLLNNMLVKQHIVPRYEALQLASTDLEMRSKALCVAADTTRLAQTRLAFHQTMDAWQGVQHIQFGPIENLMRNFSIQFWPDKKNLIGKQLNKLLKEQNPDRLTTDYFYKASIGVKGLPALERLLFGNTNIQAFADNSYRCQLTSAIASYIAENSRATLKEWDSFASTIETAGSTDSYYEDHKEAAVDMLKSLVEPVEVIRDLKILRPLGGVAKEGQQSKIRPKRSESWRSERSLQNIQINIAALHQLYSGTDKTSVKQLLAKQGNPVLADEIEQQFIAVQAQLKQIPSPLIRTLQQEGNAAQLYQLSAALKQLHLKLSTAMQPLNIQLGFNSRDGD